ncbi:hypothetical protein BDZ89DRAFT_955380, partial [Hymenopellis radicata]
WWYIHQKELPQLYRMAPDVISIPGSAVAFEHIFLSGRDMVSMRRANLSAETIRILMIVKHHLCMARMVLKDLVGIEE